MRPRFNFNPYRKIVSLSSHELICNKQIPKLPLAEEFRVKELTVPRRSCGRDLKTWLYGTRLGYISGVTTIRPMFCSRQTLSEPIRSRAVDDRLARSLPLPPTPHLRKVQRQLQLRNLHHTRLALLQLPLLPLLLRQRPNFTSQFAEILHNLLLLQFQILP